MICKHCGFENDNYSEFCVNCGASLADSAYANEDTQVFNDGNGYYGEGGYDELPVVEKKPVDVLGIVGLVLGAVSLVFGCCCYFVPFVSYITSFVAPFLALAGIIVSSIGLSKAKKAGNKSVLAIIGLILSIIMMLVNIVLVVLVVVGLVGGLGAGLLGGMSEMMYY